MADGPLGQGMQGYRSARGGSRVDVSHGDASWRAACRPAPASAVAGPPPSGRAGVASPSAAHAVGLGRGLLALDGDALLVDPRPLGASAERRRLASAALLEPRRHVLLRARRLGARRSMSRLSLRGPLALLALGFALGGLASVAPASSARRRPDPARAHPARPARGPRDARLLDGELPAALQTPSGIVGAPDPRVSCRPATDSAYRSGSEHDVFVPDRDTRRPNVSSYDDPFTPATAPFKRLEAFDAVRADYELYVRDDRLVPLAVGAPPGRDDEAFYADVVVDLASDARIRIPSVGPGAHIVRARLGIGVEGDPLFGLPRRRGQLVLAALVYRARARAGSRREGEHAAGASRDGARRAEGVVRRAARRSRLERPSIPPAAAGQRRARRGRRAGRGRRQPGDAAARGDRQARAVLPGLRRLRRPAARKAQPLPRPRAVEEGSLPPPCVRVPRNGPEPGHPDASRDERGARVGRGPRRDALAPDRPRRRGAHDDGVAAIRSACPTRRRPTPSPGLRAPCGATT